MFGRMTVWENLAMGAYVRRSEPQGEIDRDMERVYGLFPRLRERAAAVRRYHVGRRAADAGHRPRADGAARACC